MTPPDLPLHGVGEAKPSAATLCEMFDHACAMAADRIAVRHAGASLTYRQLAAAVRAMAVRLGREVPPGGTVGLLLPNSIEFVVGLFGTLQARLLPALLNPLYPGPQLVPLLEATGARALLHGPASRDLAADAGAATVPKAIGFGDQVTLADLLADQPSEPSVWPPDPGDLALLMFSGGTTGTPKQVEHTHASLMAAIRCMEYLWPTRNDGEVFLPVAPFTHIYGLLQGVMAPLSAGAESVIPERFQPELAVEMLARHQVTFFGGGPPAIYAGLLAAPTLAGTDLHALRVCPSGGAPFPVVLAERWQRATGLEIHEGYGMTEMAPICGANALTGVRPGSVGKPLPCNRVEIVDLETGTRVLASGERGEVRASGPNMMRGYRGMPEATALTMRHGFIYTGDIGYLDEDGFLFVTDRKKDVVFVKGFNVYPREVEEAIYNHPDVAGVGVVGAPDDRTGGERLVAFVTPVADAELCVDTLRAYCAARLVGYQCPSEIRIVDRLPLTGAQKLDRRALRQQAERSS